MPNTMPATMLFTDALELADHIEVSVPTEQGGETFIPVTEALIRDTGRVDGIGDTVGQAEGNGPTYFADPPDYHAVDAEGRTLWQLLGDMGGGWTLQIR